MRRDWTRFVTTARRLIRRNGQTVTIQDGSPEPTGWNPSAHDPVNITAQYVNVGYSITGRNDTLVQSGDRVGIVEATSYEIKPGDRIIIDGSTYTIVDAQPLQPATTKILTEIIARR